MGTYRSLMVEIKYRIEAVEAVLAARVSLRAKIAEELAYLQLRMICELIAIGCLVMHGNLKPKAALFKTYKADWIMSELAKLHPKFYPQPLESEDVEKNGIKSFVYRESGYLTRDDLSRLWSRVCGGKLHRGSAKNILKGDQPLSLLQVVDWHDRIIGLLSRHIILTPDEESLCLITMETHGSGDVQSVLFKQVDGPPPPKDP